MEDRSAEDTPGSPQEQEEEIIHETPLCVAVIKNDLPKLKSLMQSGRAVNSIRNRSMAKETLLQFIILHNRVEMFDYMLGLKTLQIDKTDKLGRTASDVDLPNVKPNQMS